MRRMQALDAEQGRDSSKNACALLRKIGKASPANSHLGGLDPGFECTRPSTDSTHDPQLTRPNA
jgi:hypothetical protein